MLQHADGESKPGENAAVPLGVALGQVVVDSDEMSTAPLEGIQVDGDRSDEGLAFTGLQLSDLAVVKDRSAEDLHIERALAQLALYRLAHDPEGLGFEVIEGFAFLDAVAK